MSQKKARIVYNDEHDSFDVEILTQKGYELKNRYPCVRKDGQSVLGANYIHFGILRKIADLQWMGYKVEVLE